jgi:hypothetical protein
MRDLDEMGPVDYLVVEFPRNTMNGQVAPLLVDLVDRGVIRIIDLVFVTTESDGSVNIAQIADLDGDGSLDLGTFHGASAGLLDEDDVRAAGKVLQPGSVGALLVYENVWAAPLAVALRKNGAQLVANGRIPVQGLIAALDAAETAEAAKGTEPTASTKG